MPESRLYNSLAAESWCKAGRFKIYGFTLRPFCFLHSFQLESLENPLWTGAEETHPEDICLAAQICAADTVVTEFERVNLDRFDALAEVNKWMAYMTMCAARPIPPDHVPASGGPVESPYELAVISYLIQHTTFTADQLWVMPYGLVIWYFESVREQVTGRSLIVSEDTMREIEEALAPEAKVARQAKEEKAKWIIKNIRDPQRRMELLNALETDTLPDNWQEVHNG